MIGGGSIGSESVGTPPWLIVSSGGISATASVTISFAAVATGTLALAGGASATIGITGAAAASLALVAGASVTIGFTGAAAATLRIAAAAVATIGFTGVATAIIPAIGAVYTPAAGRTRHEATRNILTAGSSRTLHSIGPRNLVEGS